MRARSILAFVLCTFAIGASAADEFKIIQLEQDMRNLERRVDTLNREVDQLRARLARAGDRPPPARAAESAEPTSMDWLDAANWDRVRPGMSELEVISALGPPTSMRLQDDARVLLYAMEIGSSGFLSGSVTLSDRKVVEVERPVLK